MTLNKRESVEIFRLDILLLVSVLGLMILGVAFIYSSGVTSKGQQVSDEWIKQIIWSVTGLILMVFFALIDYQRLKFFALPVYIGWLIMLVMILLVGSYVKGTRAWLGIGFIGIQPSEFGKLAVILLLSWWFDETSHDTSNFKKCFVAIVLTMIPVVLIFMQPDLGTALVYLPILMTILIFAGIGWRLLVFPLLVGFFIIIGVMSFAWSEYIAPSPLIFFRLFTDNRLMRAMILAVIILIGLNIVGWLIFHRRFFIGFIYGIGISITSYFGIIGAIRILKDYQMMRLVVFFNPQIDPKGAGWHIIQSVTAIGSGGMRGKGFLKGTQSHYRYLPEQSTDFIFSIIAEEIGFMGCLLVFTLFTIIIARSLYIAFNSRDAFGTYLAVGFVAMISYHVIQNIGMAIGVMPITGIPLFFLSYGGSSLWTALISMGILLSINFRRYSRI